MSKLFVGIDTSNYTTSIGVIDEKLNIIVDRRIVLSVDKGEKGLRQQEALFQHVKNLPVIIDSLNIDFNKIESIGISTKPRRVEGSYMPVFLAGEGFGRSLSKALGISLKKFSHQEGHIGALLIKEDIYGSFLCFHLSGGTTEVLKCENNIDSINIETIGGTLDISFGQLIDRIGVSCGFDFPCGREMEILAEKGLLLDLNISIKQKGGYINLSGLENKFKDILNMNTYKVEDVLYTLFVVIAEGILSLLDFHKIDEKILITGGVISNEIIRKRLLDSKHEDNLVFTDVSLSTDNGVGIAYLSMNKKGWEE